MELTAQQYCWLLAHVLTQPAEPPPKQVPAGQRTVSWFEDCGRSRARTVGQAQAAVCKSWGWSRGKGTSRDSTGTAHARARMLTVHVCPFSLQTSLLLPLKQVNTVQPLSSQVPLRHLHPEQRGHIGDEPSSDKQGAVAASSMACAGSRWPTNATVPWPARTHGSLLSIAVRRTAEVTQGKSRAHVSMPCGLIDGTAATMRWGKHWRAGRQNLRGPHQSVSAQHSLQGLFASVLQRFPAGRQGGGQAVAWPT